MAQREWSPAEDLRPGATFREITNSRGKVLTVPIYLDWQLDDSPTPIACWTWLTIRECSGDTLIESGRIYQRLTDDGA